MSRSTNPSSRAAESVPVLTWHALAAGAAELEAWPPAARLYVLTLDEFRRQLDHLAAGGFEAVSMADFARWHAGEAGLPERPVVLSFDDGHRSNAELAAPALAERGQRAIFFVTAGHVGRGGSVAWPQLRELLEGGMEVGSHTLTHRMPSTLTTEELEGELTESKRLLEAQLGGTVDFVASPTGYDSRHFAALARRAGYRAALQGVIGRNRRSTDLFALRRFVLKRTYGFETFCRLVEPGSRAYLRLRAGQAVRNGARRLLGVRGYEAARRLLIGRRNGERSGND